MIDEKKIEEFLFELNIPPGVIQRFHDVAHMCGILSDELMIRLVMRLWDDSEEVMRNLVDSRYEWKKAIE